MMLTKTMMGTSALKRPRQIKTVIGSSSIPKRFYEKMTTE